MTSFDKRKKAHEAKFARDQESEFKANARRNKLLGLWAAEFLGLTGSDADAYALEVVKSDFDRPGDEDVFEKVWADLSPANVDVSEHRLRRQMEDLLEEAREQIDNEGAA
ncbi:MAG: DUF1476 domain-containing protein [Alphaproteobacteria bacterium]|jgi:hypothetical protein|nr:hypothetical protein [Rhodospirillaceae bacterium]MDP6404554.1 DUF1476 domain-containing protein [Alphaproteobacteria bacterium]MDP6623038.1 DUF1476 domain-containing protein [Alphaproteobacteria bacterium]|tara:strand:- start:2485 stop:2814 length:330 start_codon:yes stop_codon:yes gene_type:complete